MTPIFEACLKHILKMEGEFVDHPLDQGGPTKFGITLQALRDYNGLPSIPASVIKELTLEQATAIYQSKYWNTMRLDRVRSQKLALVLFDQGVNAGPITAVKMLQEVLNQNFAEKLVVDGQLGNKTDVAVATAPEALLIRKLIHRAQDRYVSICVKKPDQLAFLAGWINRTQALQDATA